MVPVTLPVGGWNTLIGILARAEGRGINWEIVDPLIGVIRQQVTQKATGNRGLRSVDEAS
jgi:hypothetical protein